MDKAENCKEHNEHLGFFILLPSFFADKHTRLPDGLRLAFEEPTVTNLGVNEMLALLDRLESAVRTFTEREEKLTGEYRARSSATAKAFEKATEERASQLAERIAGAETAFKLKSTSCSPI